MKPKALIGLACPWGAVCLSAAAWCLVSTGGCQREGIGMNTPGLYEKIELGKPLPAEVWQGPAAPRLGVSFRQDQERSFDGEAAREMVRAAVDERGNVVVSHSLRMWRRRPLLGPGEDQVRFTLDLRVWDMSSPPAPAGPGGKPAASVVPAGSTGSSPLSRAAGAAMAAYVAALTAPATTAPAAPDSVFNRVTTVPAGERAVPRPAAPAPAAALAPAAPRPAAASAPGREPAPPHAGPLGMKELAGGACLDAPLDEMLVEQAREQALGLAFRPASPGNWQDFDAAWLTWLNQQRKAEHLPPATTVAGSVADLVLLAEIMLEAIPIQGQADMDRIVWRGLDMPAALRRVPAGLPDKPGQETTWSHVEVKDSSGTAFTMDLPYTFRTTYDRTRISGTLMNLGNGRVRLVLQAQRLIDLPQ